VGSGQSQESKEVSSAVPLAPPSLLGPDVPQVNRPHQAVMPWGVGLSTVVRPHQTAPTAPTGSDHTPAGFLLSSDRGVKSPYSVSHVKSYLHP
jgi:hypothetical protein